MKTRNVYVTRDTIQNSIDIRPDTVGIRKFNRRPCTVRWGAAWNERYPTAFSYKTGLSVRQNLMIEAFKAVFGFIPRKGTAYYIDGKGKRTKVDIDFTN